jgi:enoyl-CoA hydratase/carnithine racemase
MFETLHRKFAEFDASDQRVAVLTGAGENFCIGADLTNPPDPPHAFWKIYPTIGMLTEKPVICAVDGICSGAAVAILVLSDLCIASERAQFHCPEGRIGGALGGIAALAARIPHKLAMEITLLGRPLPAQRAYEMGLVNQVVPNGTQLKVALEIAHELEEMAPLVLKLVKRFVIDTLAQSPYEKLGSAMRELEKVLTSEDCAKGVAAFVEKRPYIFTGR